MLACEVERVFQQRGWRSYQQAEIATRVPASTLQRLRRGAFVKAETVIRFGVAVGEEEDRWRRIAVGLPSSPSLHESPSTPYDPTDGEQTPAARALSAYGQIVDAAPYLYALERVHEASAGDVERLVAVDSPTSDLRPPKAHLVTAVLVKGTCMEPYARDGETVLVLPPETVADGCIVTATVDVLNIVCKRIRVVDGTSWLETANGQGRIPEGRFVVTGVLAHVIRSLLPLRSEEVRSP